MITSDDILGKDVLDPDGDALGVVSKLHVDEDTYGVVGLTVDQGFGSPSLYIGIDNVDRVGVDAVLLSKRPLTNVDGKEVYTRDGSYLGRVADVEAVDDAEEALVIEDGTSKRTVSKHRVVEKGDVVIVDYAANP